MIFLMMPLYFSHKRNSSDLAVCDLKAIFVKDSIVTATYSGANLSSCH
jgi:hypothetical protein